MSTADENAHANAPQAPGRQLLTPDAQAPTNYLEAELTALLRDDPQIFRFIERASLDGLWYWDLERPENEWMSPRFWETLGYDPAEMPHASSAWMAIIDADDLALAKENVARHIADASHPYDQVVRYRHRAGHTVTVRCRGLAIRDADGQAVRLLGAHNDLTRERQLASLLRETAEAAGIGSWHYDVAAGSFHGDEQFGRLLGYGEDVDWDEAPEFRELAERHLPDGPEKDALRVLLARCLRTGEACSRDVLVRAVDGRECWMRARMRALHRDGGGGAARVLAGSIQDIDEEKRAQLQLARNEELLRMTNDDARIGAWTYDVRAERLRYTPAVERLYGYDEPQEWTVAAAVAPLPEGPEKDAILGKFARCIGEGVSYEGDFPLVRADGVTRWMRTRGRARRDARGNVVEVIGSFQDIDESKRATLELAERERALRRNFDNAPHGMVVADARGRFRQVSRSFAELIGYTRAELTGGMGFRELKHPGDRVAHAAMLERFATGAADTERLETRFVHRDGHVVWADVSVSCTRDAAGGLTSLRAQLVDVTATRREAARERRVAMLEEKARDMERFAYVASHDLRQPVLTVQGYLDTLREDYAEQLDEEAVTYFNIMEGALGRMDEMIKGLLDHSRLSKAKALQDVDLAAVAAAVIADLHELIRETDAEIVPGRLPVVHGYPLELRQLLQNLITNALKYRRPGVAPRVRLSYEEVEGGTRFCVEDNGRGVAPGDRERIFRLFQRGARDEDGGTGIGLANCRLIAERHGGSLWVESTPGEGSRFYFEIVTEDFAEAGSEAPGVGAEAGTIGEGGSG